MKQINLDSTGFEHKTKRICKRVFLDEMLLVLPWADLVALIARHASTRITKDGRPSFAVSSILRIHFLQQWFNLTAPTMEEALYDTPMSREFLGLDMGEDHLTHESIILLFRHLSVQSPATVNATLTAKGLLLKQGTVVDTSLMAAPSSTNNWAGTRDAECHQIKKGNQWRHGLKAPLGADSDRGAGQVRGHLMTLFALSNLWMVRKRLLNTRAPA